MAYLWESEQWPELRWDDHTLTKLLARTSREQGRLLGKMEGLGFDLRSEAHLRTLTEDVVKSSEIEGEKLDRDQVRSSIARRLGMDVGGLVAADRHVQGVVELMLDATDNMLERTQKSDVDVTRWQTWLLECLLRAIESAQETLSAVLAKARFWERFAKEPLNERQIKVIDRLFDGFEGKLTSSKWATLTNTSQDTAHRDIIDLLERGALRKDEGGGRSTSYSLVTD